MTGTDAAKWLLVGAALAVAAVGIYFKYERVQPCATPVAYAVGAIDPRFGTATSTVLAELKAATAIWNKAGGKTLLTYDPAAPLKVNLVYDEREASAKLGAAIAKTQAALDARRATLDAERASYEAKQAAYNNEVRTINARGGATPSEARTLEAERAALAEQGAALDSDIKSYNAGASALNQDIREYNQTAGVTFEEGQYVRDKAGERINIFEFVDATQLERVLAHELGHALGLEHNDDPDSIMYAENESGNLKPTEADLAALKALCGA